MKYTVLSLSLAFMVTAQAATISLDIQAEQLRTSGGVAANDGLVMLVADVNGTGFSTVQSNANLSVGSFLDAGNDNLILFKDTIQNTTGTAGAFFAGPTLDFNSASFTGKGWNTGDKLALLWFPTLTASSTIAASGTTYGIYDPNGAGNVDLSNNWVTPAGGASSYKLYFFDAAATTFNSGGTNPASAGNASLTVGGAVVTPEPTRAFLLAAGFGLMFLRRRRK